MSPPPEQPMLGQSLARPPHRPLIIFNIVTVFTVLAYRGGDKGPRGKISSTGSHSWGSGKLIEATVWVLTPCPLVVTSGWCPAPLSPGSPLERGNLCPSCKVGGRGAGGSFTCCGRTPRSRRVPLPGPDTPVPTGTATPAANRGLGAGPEARQVDRPAPRGGWGGQGSGRGSRPAVPPRQAPSWRVAPSTQGRGGGEGCYLPVIVAARVEPVVASGPPPTPPQPAEHPPAGPSREPSGETPKKGQERLRPPRSPAREVGRGGRGGVRPAREGVVGSGESGGGGVGPATRRGPCSGNTRAWPAAGAGHVLPRPGFARHLPGFPA